MKRDTLKAYRSRAKATHDAINAELARQKAEAVATRKANVAAYDAQEDARVRYTRDDLIGATAVRTRLYGWRLVRTVNAKTISIDSGYSWADKVKFEDVLAFTKAEVKQ